MNQQSSEFDLHEERLHTTDEHGHRVYVHPEDLKGTWKIRRTVFYSFLVLIYMIVPWIYIDGKQLILLDLPNREFHFGSTIFFAHDVPYLFFLLIGFIFLFAFITSVWGRVWCGWGCPQTVFLDLIYRPIERLVEGRSRRRMKLDQEKMGLVKFVKKSVKWILFTLVSLHISHSLLGYFVGTRSLLEITLSNPSEHWSLFLTMIFITGVFLFDFGWFREQFCIIMCPYGRIQSVFMDPDSLVVGYDEKRGEPRKGKDNGNAGDCVNCYQCVKVCPTGIDIRRGTQLECIACTACIDACDNIMTRLSKPKGLIRYASENEFEGKEKKRWLRPRSIVYIALITIIFSSGAFFISHKGDLRAVLVRAGNIPYQTKVENSKVMITNHYKLDLYYQGSNILKINLDLPLEERSRNISLINISKSINLRSEKKKVVHVFFKFPKNVLVNGLGKTELIIKDQFGKEVIKEVPLVGPYE